MSKKVIDFIFWVYHNEYKSYDELVAAAKKNNVDLNTVSYIMGKRRDDREQIYKCIELLSIDGENTKAKVKQILQEVLNAN